MESPFFYSQIKGISIIAKELIVDIGGDLR